MRVWSFLCVGVLHSIDSNSLHYDHSRRRCRAWIFALAQETHPTHLVHQPLHKPGHASLIMDGFDPFLPPLSHCLAYGRNPGLADRRTLVVCCARESTTFYGGCIPELEYECSQFCAWLVLAGLNDLALQDLPRYTTKSGGSATAGKTCPLVTGALMI